MLTFWLIILGMLAISLCFIGVPLFSRRSILPMKHPDLSSDLNIKIYHQQCAELQQQRDHGEINEMEFSRQQYEFKKTLLQDMRMPSPIKQNLSAQKQFPEDQVFCTAKETHGVYDRFSIIIAVMLLIFISASALFLYNHWGASANLSIFYQQQQEKTHIQAVWAQLGSREHLIAALKQRLQQTPDSGKGWYLLGRLYMLGQEYQLASNAFSQANRLIPNNLTYMLQYAQALLLANHNRLGLRAHQLVAQILANSPDDANALNLLAIDAFNRHQYQQAIAIWRKLLTQFPSDSQDRQHLLQMIAEADFQKKVNGVKLDNF